ncbi:MAG: cytochrome c biogenesis protein ResB [Acidobacteriota bacterium]
MSALEETIKQTSIDVPKSGIRRESILSRFLKVLCSVRLGVGLLITLALACLTGMLIMQQNVEKFDRYYAELTPAQRLVYGGLGFFDIYHSWYFNVILCVLSLNIILASIDRFPKTWTYASKRTLTVPIRWMRDQKQTDEMVLTVDASQVEARIKQAMKESGWRKIFVSEKGGRTFIMGEAGLWNRFGAYAVHVALLTIFTGGFLTAQFGNTGQMPLTPGQSTNLMLDTVVELDKTSQITKQLPFEIFCTDIQQKLIRKDGPINVQNTIDWVTQFKIRDETGTHDASVQMNHPFDYRGYRFFQASFIPIGRARNILVRANPTDGAAPQEVTIKRGDSATLADGKQLRFTEFRGDFKIGKEDPNEDTSEYPNPGAILQVVQPGGPPVTAYAFGPQMAKMPVASKPVAGYTFQLVDFERASDQHILSVQRDPGSNVVYVGFVMLFITLVSVFFFSHQRVWAAVGQTEDGKVDVVFAGNTNRSLNAFDEKFRRFTKKLKQLDAQPEAL